MTTKHVHFLTDWLNQQGLRGQFSMTEKDGYVHVKSAAPEAKESLNKLGFSFVTYSKKGHKTHEYVIDAGKLNLAMAEQEKSDANARHHGELRNVGISFAPADGEEVPVTPAPVSRKSNAIGSGIVGAFGGLGGYWAGSTMTGALLGAPEATLPIMVGGTIVASVATQVVAPIGGEIGDAFWGATPEIKTGGQHALANRVWNYNLFTNPDAGYAWTGSTVATVGGVIKDLSNTAMLLGKSDFMSKTEYALTYGSSADWKYDEIMREKAIVDDPNNPESEKYDLSHVGMFVERYEAGRKKVRDAEYEKYVRMYKDASEKGAAVPGVTVNPFAWAVGFSIQQKADEFNLVGEYFKKIGVRDYFAGDKPAVAAAPPPPASHVVAAVQPDLSHLPAPLRPLPAAQENLTTFAAFDPLHIATTTAAAQVMLAHNVTVSNGTPAAPGGPKPLSNLLALK